MLWYHIGMTDAKIIDLTALLNKGIEYPTSVAEIFTNMAALEELAYLETAALVATSDDEANKVHEKQLEVKQRVLDSKLTIHLKALASSAVRAIVKAQQAKGGDDDEITIELIARTTTKIVAADGGTGVPEDRELLKRFIAALPETQYLKLVEAYNELGLSALRAEGLVNDPSLS